MLERPPGTELWISCEENHLFIRQEPHAYNLKECVLLLRFGPPPFPDKGLYEWLMNQEGEGQWGCSSSRAAVDYPTLMERSKRGGGREGGSCRPRGGQWCETVTQNERPSNKDLSTCWKS